MPTAVSEFDACLEHCAARTSVDDNLVWNDNNAFAHSHTIQEKWCAKCAKGVLRILRG